MSVYSADCDRRLFTPDCTVIPVSVVTLIATVPASTPFVCSVSFTMERFLLRCSSSRVRLSMHPYYFVGDVSLYCIPSVLYCLSSVAGYPGFKVHRCTERGGGLRMPGIRPRIRRHANTEWSSHSKFNQSFLFGNRQRLPRSVCIPYDGNATSCFC